MNTEIPVPVSSCFHQSKVCGKYHEAWVFSFGFGCLSVVQCWSKEMEKEWWDYWCAWFWGSQQLRWLPCHMQGTPLPWCLVQLTTTEIPLFPQLDLNSWKFLKHNAFLTFVVSGTCCLKCPVLPMSPVKCFFFSIGQIPFLFLQCKKVNYVYAWSPSQITFS